MKANHYVAFNSIIMNVKTFIVIIIFFLSSRFLMQALGIEGFGLYSLIIGITVTLEFIFAGLTSTTSRYTILAIAKNDLEYSREVFNTINVANRTILIWFLVILEIFGMIMIMYVLKMPDGKLITSIVIFQLMVLDNYYRIKVIPHNSLLLAKENFLFINGVAIIVALLRLIFILLLFIVPFDKLIFYAIIMFSLSFASREITIRFVFKRYAEAYLNEKKYYNQSLQKEVLSFLKYSWIGQMSAIIKKQGANFLLNIFSGGVILNAAYATASQVASISDVAISPVTGAILPQALKSYSAGNHTRFQNLTLFNSKLAITISWIFMIPLLLESNFVLNIWLKDVPLYTSEFLILILLDEMIRQLTNGLSISSIIAEKIKRIYMWTTIIQSFAFISIFILLKMGFQFWYIFYINIGISVIFMLINLIFAHNYIGINIYHFFIRIIFPTLIIGGITICLMMLLKHFLLLNSSFNSLVIIALSFLFSLTLFLFLLFNKDEKNKIKNIAIEILLKFKAHVNI